MLNRESCVEAEINECDVWGLCGGQLVQCHWFGPCNSSLTAPSRIAWILRCCVLWAGIPAAARISVHLKVQCFSLSLALNKMLTDSRV